MTKDKKSKIICFCNGIKLNAIEAAIQRGCKNLNSLMNATSAGLGQCGGSCRPDLEKLLKDSVKSPSDKQ